MKTQVLVFYLLFVSTALSQEKEQPSDPVQKYFYVQIESGVNMSGVKSAIFKDIGVPKFGFRGGGLFGYRKGLTSVETGVLYSMKGHNFEASFSDQYGNLIGTEKSEYHFNYLDFPLLFGLNLGRKVSFYTKMGGKFACLVEAREFFPGFEGLNGFENDITQSLRRLDLLGVVQIGLNIDLGRIYLNTNLSAERGLFSVVKYTLTQDFNRYNRLANFSLGLGYKF